MQAKGELRKAMLAKRDALSPQVRANLSERIATRIVNMPGFRQADVVLAYMSFGSEFDTTNLIKSILAHDKVLVLPRVNREGNRLDLYRVKNPATELIPGAWNIREPDISRCASWNDETVDFVVVPGLAFDPECNRLGYGGGYYDRLLEELGPFPSLIAGAFSSQVIDSVPAETHDTPIDVVVTEDHKFVRDDFSS